MVLSLIRCFLQVQPMCAGYDATYRSALTHCRQLQESTSNMRFDQKNMHLAAVMKNRASSSSEQHGRHLQDPFECLKEIYVNFNTY